MSVALMSAVIAGCFCGSILLAAMVRRLLPEHHLNDETKDAVKVSMGLVATMSALLLGLLVSSAKGSYDQTRRDVIQMGAKIAFLDRVLALYGPETAALRDGLRSATRDAVTQMWGGDERGRAASLGKGDALYVALQGLSPHDDLRRSLKDQAVGLAMDIAQMRTLLHAQSATTISRLLLAVVICWICIIFFSFTLFAPANGTANAALVVAALSVAGAIFLILQLDSPFTSFIKVSSEPLSNALSCSVTEQIGNPPGAGCMGNHREGGFRASVAV